MSSRPPRFLVEDMLEGIDKARRYSAGMTLESFEADERTVDAVVRNLEIIGEAASRLPQAFRETHLDIPWGNSWG